GGRTLHESVPRDGRLDVFRSQCAENIRRVRRRLRSDGAAHARQFLCQGGSQSRPHHWSRRYRQGRGRAEIHRGAVDQGTARRIDPNPAPAMTMNKPVKDIPHPKLLLDPYASWAQAEGVPIVEDFGVDLLKVPTAPWPRFGVDGSIAHLKGRGDFVSVFVLDLKPGAQTSPQKHLFEE